MSRLYSRRECPDCHRVPKQGDREQVFVCDCPDKSWACKIGITGTDEDLALLEKYNWYRSIDMTGSVSWVGPHGDMLYLYEDGTWAGSTAAFEKLDDYLDWYARAYDKSALSGMRARSSHHGLFWE